MRRTRIYRKRTTSTAITVEEEYYPVWEGPKGRGRKLRPTSDAQQILNDKKSLKHFTDLVNNNFRQYEDLKIELTYCDARKPDGIDDARRLHAAFVRRLRRWYERRGKELKYVVVDEIGKNGTMRPHHHMLITGGIDYKTLKTLWGNGSVNISPIDYEQYGSASWCEYVFKDPRYSRKWRGSRNLTPPDVKERDSENNGKTAVKLLRSFESGKPFAPARPGYTAERVEIKRNPYNKDVYVRIRWVKEDLYEDRRKSAV